MLLTILDRGEELLPLREGTRALLRSLSKLKRKRKLRTWLSLTPELISTYRVSGSIPMKSTPLPQTIREKRSHRCSMRLSPPMSLLATLALVIRFLLGSNLKAWLETKMEKVLIGLSPPTKNQEYLSESDYIYEREAYERI